MEVKKSFTCIGRGHGAPVMPATKEDWLKMRREKWLADMCRRIKQGDDELKHRLPVWTPHCAEFANNHRATADALIPLSRLMLDFDEKGHTDEIVERLKKQSPLRVLLIEESVRGGTHVLVALNEGMEAEEAQRLMREATGFEPDKAVKDIARCIYMVSDEHTRFVDEDLFKASPPTPPSRAELAPPLPSQGARGVNTNGRQEDSRGTRGHCSPQRGKVMRLVSTTDSRNTAPADNNFPAKFKEIPYAEIIAEFWRKTGGEPQEGERNMRLHQLAANLRAICDNNEDWLLAIMPRYGLSEQEMRSIIHSACKEPTKGSKLMNQILQSFDPDSRLQDAGADESEDDGNQNSQLSTLHSQLSRLPQGVRDSVDAVGPQLAMPVVTAICPAIGMLATGVRLDVHGVKNSLNLISYIAGDFASGKGSIDPVIEAWTAELKAQERVFQEQEEEWRAKKRAAKNKKEQPEEPKFPVRLLTLNNTVANLAERLANTDGRHAFSFTPEADTVAQKWKSAINDFSVMLRQSYDGTRYDREARSAEAVNVHIDHLLWNVTMCGTPDALYRVVANYTDGFQSRIAVARTPDNTFSPLEEKPHVLTPRQMDRIQQIAHLLPLMQGEVVLQKLEQRGREWLEQIRLETIKSDDRIRARQRFRVCVTAQRMVCCLMLCKVCESLIKKHGLVGAEKHLRQYPNAWKTLLQKTQTADLLNTFNALADYLLETALFFFRERIENAFASSDYAGSSDRQRIGKNDSIFARLDATFSFDDAHQWSLRMKGTNVSRNQVRQMLKNWTKQGLITRETPILFHKVLGLGH